MKINNLITYNKLIIKVMVCVRLPHWHNSVSFKTKGSAPILLEKNQIEGNAWSCKTPDLPIRGRKMDMNQRVDY